MGRAELLARVYADPADDATRAVLADLLVEMGDPRGEFISMQLARFGTTSPPSAAEKKLQREWGRAWLGALEPAAQKSGVVFERGFVRGVKLTKTSLVMPTLGAIEWTTVVDVDMAQAAYGANSIRLLTSEPLRRARHVIGINPFDVEVLTKEGLTWETVGFGVHNWSMTGAATSNPFPQAKKLVVEAMDRFTLDATPTTLASFLGGWRHIEELELQVEPSLLPRIIGFKLLPKLRRVTCRTDKLTATFDLERQALWLGAADAGLVEQLAPTEVYVKGKLV